MRLQKKSAIVLAVSIILTGLFGTIGMTATAQAASEAILVTFTDTSPVQYSDLSGNAPGEGTHVGELRCVGEVCNQKIEFQPLFPQPGSQAITYEYKFKSREAFDPAAGRVVVSGTGTLYNGGPRTRFSFSAVFQDNGDGTLQVTYIASTPEASFSFPAAPGTFGTE